jgi:nucleotidyltransferase/DNA polymerase involved in DNA repair
MLRFVREASPAVEYYSIDEFFFAAVPLPGLSLQETAEALRDRAWRELRLPVTVGVGRSKTLTKLISDTAKPFGALALLGPEAEAELLARRPVSDITGIAGRRAASLARHGVHTCLDFARADRRLVRMLLTVTGERLWWEANGEPAQPLHTERPPHKVLSRGGSLGEVTADPDRLWGWAVRNLERLVEELEYHAVQVGRLAVYLGRRAGPGAGGEARLGVPTDRFDLLLEAAWLALRRAWGGWAVDRMHLVASRLQYPRAVQPGLFEPPAERAEAVARVKRAVNERVGRFVVRSGATLYVNDVYRDKAQSYDICDVRGKMCF